LNAIVKKGVVPVTRDPIDRFSDPLYTRAEAARFLGVAESTMVRWTKDTEFVTSIPAAPGNAAIPFIGLAEAYTLAAFRSLGVPLQRIRPALTRLEQEFGLQHALASERLYTDGAEILFEYGSDIGDRLVKDLVVVRKQQPVFRDVIADYLQRIVFDHGYAQRIPLIGYKGADLFVDPRRSFGQPTFDRGGARLVDALDLFRAGEPLEVVAEEFGIPSRQLEAAVRASLPAAA
jgi:uncharacterized protein (DUF433 family)